MQDYDWKIWAGRLVFSLAATSLVAWGISFKVADYVVRANTTGLTEAITSLQSSIDRLNESVISNSGRLDAFTRDMSTLVERSAFTVTEITALRTDMERVHTAVQDAGIDIRIGAGVSGKTVDWSSFKATYGIDQDAPVYLRFPGTSPE